MSERILRNRARCLICDDIIESKYRNNFVTCSCGNLSVDGGTDYIRRGFRNGRNSFKNMNEYGEKIDLDSLWDELKGGAAKMKYIKTCRVRCLRCGDVLEYENKTKEDNPPFVLQCSCMRVALDPSATLYRILTIPPGTPEDYEDLSEPWEE